MSRILDNAAQEERAAIKLHAHAATVEYEDEYDDEYDDSYDDLGGGGADGVADVEGKRAVSSTFLQIFGLAFPGHKL